MIVLQEWRLCEVSYKICLFCLSFRRSEQVQPSDVSGSKRGKCGDLELLQPSKPLAFAANLPLSQHFAESESVVISSLRLW